MKSNTSRDDECPARPTHRLCTDGGTATVYRARRRHGRNRTDHTDRHCPLLQKASAVDEEDVETIDDERLCPYCAGDDDWNESDDDDWGYQKALAREAGVDTEIVTDGGEETVIVKSTKSGQSIRSYHTDPECPAVAQMAVSKRRSLRNVPDAATECSVCAGETRGGHNPDWSAQNTLRNADPDDLVTDGGREMVLACPNCDSARVTTVQHNPHGGEPAGDGSHYCKDCYTHVDPVEREAYRRGRPTHGLAKALADADPDDLVTDGGQITACPECDAACIKRRSPQKPDSPSHQTHRWVCLDCDARFDEPAEREPKRAGTGLSGTAAALDAADPDAIPDGGRDLPTHHGVCRDCPDEWVGGAQSVHRDAEIHSLAHDHRTEVQQVDGGDPA